MHPAPTPRSARQNAHLVAADVSVQRGGLPVLSHVDLALTPASRVAIVGENGRGKSTLLHLLRGSLLPDSGSVTRVGTVALAEQEPDSTPQSTVGEVVAAAIAAPLAALAELDAAARALADDAGAADRYQAALDRATAMAAWDAERSVGVALRALSAEHDRDRLLSELSVGQRFRIRLACLLGGDADFLLLDEPTNHLDRPALEFLTSALRERRGGVVVVSHDRALLSDVAETFVDLDPSVDGRPRVSGNGFAGYREDAAAARERWRQRFDRQGVERERLQDSLSAAHNRLVSGWRPEKGSNKHGRATRAGGLVQGVRRRQEQLDAQALPVPAPPMRFQMPELTAPAGGSLISAEAISVAGRLPRPVSLALARGGRLVVTGANGAGKSTLLGVLAGTVRADTGRVRLRGGVRLGFLGQESALPAGARVSDLFTRHLEGEQAAGRVPRGGAVGLGELGLLSPRERGKRVGELSVGQRRRLDLALTLSGRPQLLLLDEPTNHLSIGLVAELTEALGATPAAVLLASHDRQLLRDTAAWPRLRLSPAAAAGEPG